MNYKIALSAAFIAAVGLIGCDSRYSARNADVRTETTTSTTTDYSAPATDPVNTKADAVNTKNAVAVTQPTSGVSSEAKDDIDDSRPSVYHQNDYDNDDLNTEDDISSGSTSEPMDEPIVTYKQSDLPGGMTPQDRNLRYGLIGNGTGMGLEDTTSKFMTDNYTISDPTISRKDIFTTGALSAPTDDQDALKDIKSGTTFDADHYDIEE